MTYNQNNMKRGFASFGILSLAAAVIAVLFIPVYLWIAPKLHDRTLVRFSKPLLSISVPENTQQIDALSRVGLQSGNSNHCDYLAALLLKTGLKKNDLEAYYQDSYKGESTVEFFWINEPHGTGIGNVNPTGIFTLNDWVNNVKPEETDANVIVYIFEGDMTSSLDLRCR